MKLITAQQVCVCACPVGLRHLLYDIHSQRLVTSRLTLWQRLHGRPQLDDLPSHMQHSNTCKCKPEDFCNCACAPLFYAQLLFLCMQFLSFSPAIKYWVTTFDVDFSRLLLTAT